MDYSQILSHASFLRKNSSYKVTIAEWTRSLLIDLHSDISKANSEGLSAVTIRLPINFDQKDKSVSNTELQVAIYYNIIVELEKKDYRASLKFDPECTLLSVCWSNKATIAELETMKEKIMSLRQ